MDDSPGPRLWPGVFHCATGAKVVPYGVVYPVDRNDVMLSFLKSHVERSLSPAEANLVEMAKEDVARTGIQRESVDLVFFANVLHDIREPTWLSQEVKRISTEEEQLTSIGGRMLTVALVRRLKKGWMRKR